MPEARDRLARADDVADTLASALLAAYAHRRTGNLGVLVDPTPQPAVPDLLGSPTGQRTPAGFGFGARRVVGGGGGLLRTPARTPRVGSRRNSVGFLTPARENTPTGSSRLRRGRATNSVLPSWYPRRPLQDITSISAAIERRRARMVESNGENTEGQVPRDQSFLDQSLPISGVPVTPYTAVQTKRCLPRSVAKVSKIIRDVTNQPAEGEFLTPQKKLLNSIDTVEKVVMEELQRLKRTPTAKKAEREKRVRTLMSMR